MLLSEEEVFTRPVGVLEATNYCSLENAPAVLNSVFTVLKTYTNKGAEGKRYFSKSELNSIFNPIQESNPQNLLPDNTNVVFILLKVLVRCMLDQGIRRVIHRF